MASEHTKTVIDRIEKRVFSRLEDAMKESSKKEAARRAAWMAEEQERRLRMKNEAIQGASGQSDPIKQEAQEQKTKTQEELLHIVNYAKTLRLEEDARLEKQMEVCKEDVGQEIVREISRTEVLIAEARERQRRMQEGISDPLLSDLHEKIQEEFMSQVSRKTTAKLEEQERSRRVLIDKKIEAAQDFEAEVESNLNYLKTIIAEECERDRRMMEELGYGTPNNPVSEEIVREVTRRQTWMMEERERARRILEGEASDVENEMERLFNHEVVIKLEEEERRRRMQLEKEMKSQAHEKMVHPTTSEGEKKKIEITEFPTPVQEEFMSAVSRIASRKAEEKERTRRLVLDAVTEDIRSQANLFLTWSLEERERRRRIFEEVAMDFEELLERQTLKQQVLEMEEKERERRIRMEKTHQNHPESHQEDLSEEMRHEFMSKMGRKCVAEQEEEERQRRIAEEKVLRWREEERLKLASQLSRIATRRLEEGERERRVHESLETKFQEDIERELNRRRVIALEEEERLRRVMEEKEKGKGMVVSEKTQSLQKEILATVAHQKEVSQK